MKRIPVPCGSGVAALRMAAACAALDDWCDRPMTKVAHDVDAANPTLPQALAAAND